MDGSRARAMNRLPFAKREQPWSYQLAGLFDGEQRGCSRDRDAPLLDAERHRVDNGASPAGDAHRNLTQFGDSLFALGRPDFEALPGR